MLLKNTTTQTVLVRQDKQEHMGGIWNTVCMYVYIDKNIYSA